MTSRTDLYQAVTDRIVATLEAGTVPWICPWSSSPDQAMPSNLSSGHQYRGINVLLLNMTRITRGYALNRWLTFNQARSLGGHVRQGETGSEVIFFKMLEVDDDGSRVDFTSPHAANDEPGRRVIPLIRSFTVFNAAQVEGLPEALVSPPEPVACFEPIEAAEAVLRASGAHIQHGGERAFYRPADNLIQLPPKASFGSPEGYYNTALHELAHWSGASNRCNRPLLGRAHIEAYAFEELVAEMGSAFLSGHCGIHGVLQHASYVASWLEALRNDKRLIFSAAALAQKAADYLLAFQDTAPVPHVQAAQTEEVAA